MGEYDFSADPKRYERLTSVTELLNGLDMPLSPVTFNTLKFKIGDATLLCLINVFYSVSVNTR